MADTNTPGMLMVGEGVFMKGTIKVPGVATVDGKIEGVISADTIYVTNNGGINGKTAANHVRVGGTLTDTTVASKTLVVESVGKVIGSITYAELEIKRGGILQGNIVKVKDGQTTGYAMAERNTPVVDSSEE